MKIVCLIPARGGSKRIKNKNIVDINGKPLLAHAIEKCKKVGLIDEVWVSTDDKQIAKVAKEYRAKVHKRPPELSQDKTPSGDVMVDFAEKNEFSMMIMHECTSPMTTTEDIEQMILKFLNDDYDSMLSLINVPYYFWEIRKNIAKPISYTLDSVPITQEYLGHNIEKGGLYIISRDVLLRERKKLGGKIGYFLIEHFNIDIDSEEDVNVVRKLL